MSTEHPPTTDRRPMAAVPIATLPTQLRANADQMNGWGAGNEAEQARQAADEIERLRSVLVHIATMDCYTREGEEMPHLLMMRFAKEALA